MALNYRIKAFRDFLLEGLTPSEIVSHFMALDYQLLPELDQQSAGSLEQWQAFVDAGNENFAALLNQNDQIIGYWHFEIVEPELFRRIKAGKVADGDIKATHTLTSPSPGMYNLYIIMVALLPGFQHTKAYSVLWNSFLRRLANLANEAVFIDQICTNAYTKGGERLTRRMGLSVLSKAKSGGIILVGNFPNLVRHNKFWQEIPELVEAYAKI